MGMAKYYEDNIEIMFERLFMIEDHKCVADNNLTGAVKKIQPVKNSLPTYEECLSDIKDPKHKYEDYFIICRDCGNQILFSAHSQKYFDSQKWEAPKRCKHCRDIRTITYAMCASF